MSGQPLPLTIALCQWSPGPTPADNVESIRGFARAAATGGADILVTPEYSHTSIAGGGPDWVARAELLNGPFTSALSEIARESAGLTIIAGMLETSPVEAKPYNSLVAVDERGVAAVNRKIHLYDAFGYRESQWITPAPPQDPQILELGGWLIAGQTCYDLRFPEVSRRLADAGAAVIVIPAQWMPGPHKLLHWRTLIQARAIENQCYVVAVDQPAPHGIGHSLVVAPDGEILLELDEAQRVESVELDYTALEQVREANPMSKARRFEVDWAAGSIRL